MSPKVIIPNVTSHFSLSCTLPKNLQTDLHTVNSLVIYEISKGTRWISWLFSDGSKSPDVNISAYEIVETGDISLNGPSFLKSNYHIKDYNKWLVLRRFDDHQEYVCKASGTDHLGAYVVFNSTVVSLQYNTTGKLIYIIFIMQLHTKLI